MACEIRQGDWIEVLGGMADESVHCVVTSPPYWGLRDYGVPGQLGLEPTPEEYVEKLVAGFREVRRVLRTDGTCWVNMGDGYTSGNRPTWRSGASNNKNHQVQDDQPRPETPPGLKPKDLIGMPWRLAFALQVDGWYLRADIIWAKPNPMPESVTDRPTKSHEYVFLLTRQPRYFYDAEAVREAQSAGTLRRFGGDNAPRKTTRKAYEAANDVRSKASFKNAIPESIIGGRNLRSVWNIPTQGFAKAHFATFPQRLVVPCVKAGTSDKGCCPECGAPWARIVKRDRQATRPGKNNVDDETGMANRDTGRHVTEVRTLGWRAGCECFGPVQARRLDPKTGRQIGTTLAYVASNCLSPVPCIVLDPFAGSGTVGVVARQLGRDFIGIELNAEYAEMARKRITNPDPEPEIVDVPGQLALELGDDA